MGQRSRHYCNRIQRRKVIYNVVHVRVVPVSQTAYTRAPTLYESDSLFVLSVAAAGAVPLVFFGAGRFGIALNCRDLMTTATGQENLFFAGGTHTLNSR